MKIVQQLIIFGSILIMHLSGTAQTSWKSPDYKAEPYRKVIVLARISESTARRQLEDFTVMLLKEKGIMAIQAYAHVPKSSLASKEKFMVVADSLEADALLVFSVTGAEKQIEQKPTVSVGVGVGMYGGYMGASAPIAGGAKEVTIVSLRADFYNRASVGKDWLCELTGKLEEHTDKLALSLAKTTVKTMFKDGLFVKTK